MRQRKTLIIVTGSLFFILLMTGAAYAGTKTFGQNSYIISVDPCWQPTANMSIPAPYSAGCDANRNNRGIFQTQGMIYSMLDTGDDPQNCRNNDGSSPFQKKVLGYCKTIPIYWMIKKDKTGTADVDLSIAGDGAADVVDIYDYSRSTTPYNPAYVSGQGTDPVDPVEYMGGPYVIDSNDITYAEMSLFMSTYPNVKVHKSNFAFSGNVEKILIGRPPKVAVLNEGAISVLRDYLRASGLFNWEAYVFVQLNARDVIAGCLEDPIPATCTARRPDITSPFQLIWAPHWVVEDSWSDGNPTNLEQNQVISALRDFVEAGNAGFFECASIESLEGSQDVNKADKFAGLEYDQTNDMTNANLGGFLINRTNNPPRVDTNGGCGDTGGCGADYIVYETPDFWLTQCGGWNYDTTGGHVHNMRPKDSATASERRTYLTTLTADDPGTPEDDRFVGSSLTRFMHDDPALADYSPSSGYYVYDYLVGGRINGAPTQGYMIYFPGHKYIKCQNTGTSEVPERLMDFNFDSALAGTSVVTAEFIHPFCSAGSCPTAAFTLATGDGTSAVDSYAYIDMDSASYDPVTNTLKDVIIGNKTSGNLKVLDIVVAFTDSPLVKLTDIEDVSDSTATFIVCSPGTTSPASCAGVGGVSADDVAFTFSGSDIATDDPSNKDVTIEVLHSGCTQGYDCPTATYNLSTGTQTASSPDGSNMISLDTSTASYVYNPVTLTGVLSGIKLADIEANCADVTIDDIYVDFPGSTPGSTATLDTVYNTSKTENICTPGSTSQAKCTGAAPPPPPASSCPEGEFQIGGNKISDDDGVLKVDMSDAQTSGDDKKIEKIEIKNIGCGTEGTGNPTDDYKLYITSMEIEFPDGSSTFDKFKKVKDICDPNPDVDDSPAMCTPGSPYEVGKFGKKKKDVKLEFKEPHNNTGVVKLKVGWQCDDGTDCTIGVGGGGGGGSSWSYTLTSALDCAFNYNLASFTSTCDIDWNKSNTCGIRYVLNTLLALKYQIVTNEFSKTQAVVKDNILYKTSYDYPVYRGHLSMIDVPTDQQAVAAEVWDAAKAVPNAGAAGASFPNGPNLSNSIRYIFTRNPSDGSIVEFDPNNAATLKGTGMLEQATTDAATILINTVRGREDASLTDLDGIGELNDKLWAFENSTPALMAGSSLVSGQATRDRILFAGAADGMFHAFWAGSWDAGASAYTNGTGEEIWAYIPSALLPYLQNQPFEPDPADYSTFEPVVSVDGSPALGDFLVDPDGDGTYEWRTYVVETTMIKSLNKGIIFAMDVSDPYTPTLLWESTYDDTGVGVDKCGDDGGTNEKNCNMGNSKGVAIGRVQVGGTIKTLVFVTASWIDKKNPADYTQDCTSTPANCVYGVSAYAINLLNGDIVWETRLPYTGDATNINDTPAIPALMDIDNNGTHDYVIFGDFQGRLWGLRTTDGKSMAGVATAAKDNPIFVVQGVKKPEPILLAMAGDALPAFEVEGIDPQGKLDGSPVESAEPIGAPVSVYRNIVVFGTGGADYASDNSAYHVFSFSLNPGTSTSEVFDRSKVNIYTTDIGEKVWAKPVIDQNLNVFISTSRDYFSQQLDVSSLNSEGRIIIIGLSSGTNTIINENVNNGWFDGGFVGGMDIDRRHAYAVTFSASGSSFNTIQVGGEVFTPTASTENPFKVLWWKRF